MIKRILKILLGIFSIPICISVSLNLYQQISHINALSYLNQKYFLIGVVSYLVVHAVLFKPSYLYIFAHEMMHVIATIISGGRVTSFKVSKQGGSVGTTKSNFFIALSPYFFPFYTMIVTLLFFAGKFFFKESVIYNPFLFAVGFTLAFHIILTIDFLKIRQTDLLHAGYLFSICLIYVVNLVIIASVFSLLFDGIEFIEFIKSSTAGSKDIYVAIFNQLFL